MCAKAWRISPLPNYHPDKTIELLNHCRAIPALRKLKPYVSLGRLGLTHNLPIEQALAEGKQAWNQDSPCLYFHEGHYVVAGYDNRDKWLFDTASEAINFLQRHPASVPPLEDYNVPVLPATLRALTIDWLAGTAEISLDNPEDQVTLYLTGVTQCEAMRLLPAGVESTVNKIEYDHSQLL
ncbi:MAG: hypothetical protein EOO60_11130, partial [Hymenobacter sp.]